MKIESEAEVKETVAVVQSVANGLITPKKTSNEGSDESTASKKPLSAI